ncbi:putative nitronate monooxygenase [Cyphellophora attinorum]|uniref:Putative nitronate monooxygenase n=1 Tax=Cyphellophora attinorum TaxID=1664694 RepID=A0A0N1NVP9_9EURO|nr:putative nitronate monooxygenase [Phialophora attinorum]KPI35425.1 putative nitronate monooxygenase [Phialophora attinorum]
MASPQQIKTTLTDLLKIKHPVMLAGMNVAAGPKLAAAVTNAGGIGVIGGVRTNVVQSKAVQIINIGQVGYTPDMLREQIAELKGHLKDKNGAFGVDLLLPQVGGSARKTNYDYTKGKLNELVDIIIDSGARLFVSAVGVPPKAVVDKLHANGILYMNMIGHPKHVQKCLDLNVDIICAQGGEGGGHTGDVPTTVLIPTVAAMCAKQTSSFTKQPVQVVAAGGLFNGQSLAASLALGASGVWVGTRFVLSKEAGAPKAHKEAVRTAGFDDNVRTIIFTGRPLRVRSNEYINNWEQNRQAEIKELTAKGTIPVEHDFETMGDDMSDEMMDNARPFLMGKASAVVTEEKSAKEIVDEFVNQAVAKINEAKSMLVGQSKL